MKLRLTVTGGTATGAGGTATGAGAGCVPCVVVVVVWGGMVWGGIVWGGMVWGGIVWGGMVWGGMAPVVMTVVVVVVMGAPGTGSIAVDGALPGAIARCSASVIKPTISAQTLRFGASKPLSAEPW